MTASISARTIDALTAIATGLHDIAAAVREAGRAREAQIASQEPAGATWTGSAGPGASGGLGGRLRDLVTGADPKAAHESVDVAALQGVAREVDVLEGKHARQAQTIGELQDVRERLNMLRDLAEAIRQDSHCKHLANDIETLLKAPIEELRAEGAP